MERRFLTALSPGEPRRFEDGSGRLELARSIASPENPLTARVIVNRVWLHHFGQGIVRTPSDFGMRSDPPTHPDLLDYLAMRFVESGWSVKRLQRRVLLSSVYRQGRDHIDDPHYAERDPENRLLWRRDARRLEFEPLRDALLSAAGRLDLRIGGPAVDLFASAPAERRAVYGFIERQNLPGVLRVFDFASPDATCPRRHETTVPQQALYLMNGELVIEQARRLSQRPDVRAIEDAAARVERLHEIAFGRRAASDEVVLALDYLARQEAGGEGAPADKAQSSGLDPWARYAQVLLLSNEFAFVD